MSEKNPESSFSPVSPKILKPFPWPFLFAILGPLIVFSILFWLWKHENFLSLVRMGWLALCGGLPGLSLMIIIGSVAQFRRRPILSSFSFILSIFTFGACVWAVQIIAHEAPMWLKQ